MPRKKTHARLAREYLARKQRRRTKPSVDAHRREMPKQWVSHTNCNYQQLDDLRRVLKTLKSPKLRAACIAKIKKLTEDATPEREREGLAELRLGFVTFNYPETE